MDKIIKVIWQNMWIVFFGFGLLFFYLGYFLPIWEGPKYIDEGVGVIAIGIGLWAFSFAIKTDGMVRALANLNFDEKIAVIKGQMGEPEERLKWDLKSLSHIEEFGSREEKEEIKRIKEKIYGSNKDSLNYDGLGQKLRCIWGKFRQWDDKLDNNGNYFKGFGLAFMLIGFIVLLLNVIPVLIALQFDPKIGFFQQIIQDLTQFFTATISGLTILGVGIAIYAFGVNLIQSQQIEGLLKEIKDR